MFELCWFSWEERKESEVALSWRYSFTRVETSLLPSLHPLKESFDISLRDNLEAGRDICGRMEWYKQCSSSIVIDTFPSWANCRRKSERSDFSSLYSAQKRNLALQMTLQKAISMAIVLYWNRLTLGPTHGGKPPLAALCPVCSLVPASLHQRH